MPTCGLFKAVIFELIFHLPARRIDLSTEKDKYKDYRFTKKFSKECGVMTIPPSAFYSPEHKHLGENF